MKFPMGPTLRETGKLQFYCIFSLVRGICGRLIWLFKILNSFEKLNLVLHHIFLCEID